MLNKVIPMCCYASPSTSTCSMMYRGILGNLAQMKFWFYWHMTKILQFHLILDNMQILQAPFLTKNITLELCILLQAN